MKNSTIIAVSTCLLAFLSMPVFAQMDLKFTAVGKEEYKTLTEYTEEFEVAADARVIDLGFELESYGLKCSKLRVADGYCWLRFDDFYTTEIMPVALLNSELTYGEGICRVGRTTENEHEVCILEISNMEYQGYPDQKVSFQVRLYDSGDITFHYGSNSLAANHPLMTGEAGVVVLEEDYEKAKSNNPTEQDYYRSVVNPYSDPASPFVNTLPDLLLMKTFPVAGTVYHIQRSGFTGIGRITGADRMSIFPNPAAGRCEIKFGERKPESIQVLDLTGKIVINKELGREQGSVILELKGLPAGQYAVRGLSGAEVICMESLQIK